MSLWYLWLIFKILSTIDSSYWDTFKDWGLFEVSFDSTRRRLEITKTDRYSPLNAAISVLNFLLRAAFILNFWMFTNAGIYGANFNREMSIFFLSVIEIYRRGQWNILRMENEHLTNVGNYRATKDIPEDLPVWILKNQLEQEEEFISNKLQKQLDLIEQQKKKFGSSI